jgi:hypothetical protein
VALQSTADHVVDEIFTLLQALPTLPSCSYLDSCILCELQLLPTKLYCLVCLLNLLLC